MNIPPSQLPGRHERHLLRKQDNPLFPHEERTLTDQRLQEAQRQDHEELVAFIEAFRKLVYESTSLQPNVGSEVILRLKERLDQAYEQAARLADDQEETKSAIVKLLGVIMQAVRKGAGTDPHALSELEQEEEARRAHFELLKFPLVADMLDPDSPITEDELLPSLLSASEQEFTAAISLFDQEQRGLLSAQSRKLVAGLDVVPQSTLKRLESLR